MAQVLQKIKVPGLLEVSNKFRPDENTSVWDLMLAADLLERSRRAGSRERSNIYWLHSVDGSEFYSQEMPKK